MTDDLTNPSLKEVDLRRRELESIRQEYAEAILRYEEKLVEAREALDVAMVSAVDWGRFNATTVALVAGYKHNSSIHSARKRLNGRRVEVR